MSTITVVIADDHILLRDGLQTIINLEEDMRVVGAADNGAQAVELAARLRPDLVLMDVQMPVMTGIEAARIILAEHPQTKIVMLTTFDEEQYIIESMAQGAAGFLLKDLPGDKLIQAIRDAAKGQLLLSGVAANKLAASVARAQTGAQQAFRADKLRKEGLTFTQRERHIAQLIAEGRTNKEIARMLYMSEGTVKNYVSVVYQKIGTNDRLRAIQYLKELLQP
ncbi:response regulator transcription factor [Paenibacillus sp.]|uniref:response regulator transcription factor n=1 Tax=Paenibacillus sp. TaxID=58172 RepID=UPI002D40D250|nr:response regulator transcription factor [Paenibacillus sp.]HZG88390.1 response regulator transcription factor [Paenibacillus sp.]